MNKVYFVILLILTLISCSKTAENHSDKEVVSVVISETINSTDFREKLEKTPDAIILDVRTPDELSGGYIEGAINIDFRSSEFKSQINQLDKQATYFVYCAGGGRSRTAADLMKDLEFKKVYDLAGGFSQWNSSGFPVKLP